jgi:hypothetical protein
MAAFFNLKLDTTGPADVTISLAAGAAITASRAITATIGTSDTPTTNYQMKIWGDVDDTVNANIQPTEGASAWISYSTSQAVTLSTGDGSKTVNVKVRDHLHNPSSTASDSISLDTSVPVITITGPDVTEISKQATKNVASFSFSPDVELQAYKVKVVPSDSSLENAGTQIPTTAGSTNMSGGTVASGATVNCTINATDFETAAGGDGTYVVKVFGQETGSGIWSV